MIEEQEGGIWLDSGIWIDQEDAPSAVVEKRAKGEIDPILAERLLTFHQHGYTRFDLESPALIDATARSYEKLWRDKPNDLLYAFDGPPRRMSRAIESIERTHRYRLHDVHSHLESARDLYLHPTLHRLVEEILGEPVVAIQSLLFEYGSRQILHRDPVVVPTGAPGHLVAAWIALEDIDPGSGALMYVPGSHRLPYYEFSPGGYMFDASTMGENEINAATAWFEERLAEKNLEPELLTAHKGEALLWHASLHHGGGPVTNPNLTRKSLVVHYSTARTYPTRSITVAEEEGGGEVMRILETDRLIDQDGCRGFANPAAPDRSQ